MKSSSKTVICIMLCILLFTCAAMQTLSSGSSVTYDGDSENFVFAPSDLFENFKNVMPGDTLTQNITVSNSDSQPVSIYLKAEIPANANQEFLRQMQLDVALVSGDKLYVGTADKTVSGSYDLSENKLLSTLLPGEEAVIAVTLTVPLEMGDRWQDATGNIDWIFTSEIAGEEEPPEDTICSCIRIIFERITTFIIEILRILFGGTIC